MTKNIAEPTMASIRLIGGILQRRSSMVGNLEVAHFGNLNWCISPPSHLSRIGMDNRPYLSLKNPRLSGTPQQAVHDFAGSKHLP
jgi:hypothetical protein